MRVVVVEDEGLVALDLINLLEELGHVVCGVAATADEALLAIASGQPDVLITDVNLGPGGSGLDVAVEAYQRWRVRTLFVSGSIDSGLLARTADIEPIGYLHKPLQPEALASALGAARPTSDVPVVLDVAEDGPQQQPAA